MATVYNTLRCGLYPFKQQLVTGLLEFLNLVKLQCLLPAVRFMRSFFHMPFRTFREMRFVMHATYFIMVMQYDYGFRIIAYSQL